MSKYIHLLLFIILLAILPCLGGKFRFDNFTLYKLYPESLRQITALQELQDTEYKYDFWTDPVPNAEFVNILSSPKDKDELESFLRRHEIKAEVTMENIQEAIDKEQIKKYTRNNVRSMTWDAFYDLDNIYDWMDDLALEYPDVVTTIVGGESYEGRAIKGVKLSRGTADRIIFLEGGIHSREWISPSSVCYILNELLTSENEEIVAAVRDFDWYIFPVTNPDGYVWTHTEFRLWRKNRRPFGNNFGVDLNRNWNNNWLVTGASTNPASDTYAGLGPFSEPETRSLSEFIRSIGDKIDVYLSFHSYSQLLLIPFGNTTEPLANYQDAVEIGRRAMGALSVKYETQYRTGNIAEAIYEATGGSVDWVKEHLQVPIVYCYELRDRGTYGFLMPDEEILPNNEETMDSVMEIIHQAKRFGLISGANGLQASLAFVVVMVLGYFL